MFISSPSGQAAMEHFIIFTSILCIASAVFFTPCNSLLGTQVASGYDHQLTNPAVLPRKLRFSEGHELSIKKDFHGGHQDLATNGAKQNAAEKTLKKEAKELQSSIKTWREWVDEGGDTSQYFTMDYSRVRRRRPIHNKSLPVAP